MIGLPAKEITGDVAVHSSTASTIATDGSAVQNSGSGGLTKM
jgi:hypothetical protein